MVINLNSIVKINTNKNHLYKILEIVEIDTQVLRIKSIAIADSFGQPQKWTYRHISHEQKADTLQVYCTLFTGFIESDEYIDGILKPELDPIRKIMYKMGYKTI